MMSTELTTQSVDISTYQLRRKMLGHLAQAQELEHKFLAASQDVVKEVSTRLTDHYSALIQREMPRWSSYQADEFARYTSIASDVLMSWQRSYEALSQARAEDAQAKEAVDKAKKAKSETSNWIGMPAKGREDDYRRASALLKDAEDQAQQCASRLKGATQAATAAAERLLEDCMAKSVQLAEAADYPVAQFTRTVLIDATKRAEQLTLVHRQDQRAIHLEMQRDLDTLRQLVGDEHGH